MSTHPAILSKLLALAATAGLSVFVFAGPSHAGSIPGQALKAGVQASSPVEQIGHKRYRRIYLPNSVVKTEPRTTYAYRSYDNGGGSKDEIRELQRLFPSTNWPPSMRYVHD